MRAGMLARRAGVSTDTLRYYERKGLLAPPPRAANGYRAYPVSTWDRLQLIRRALALGISVAELGRLLDERDRGGVPCRKARSLLAGKLELLDARIAELRALRRTLRATLSDWDSRLARTPAGARASLLEAGGTRMNRRLGFALALLASVPVRAQEHATQDRGHEAGVDRRGDEGMGFSHHKVAHHFGLTKTGGFISAEVKDPAEAASAADIRKHFGHIAAAFKQGDFDLPMFIHGAVPPGVPLMKKLKGQIDYEVQQIPLGGRIAITTANPKALDAIHRFLEFQIRDHRTGDSTEVQP